MAIDEVVRAARDGFGARGFGEDDGIAVGGAKFGVEAETAAMVNEPSGTGGHVVAMLGLGGDTAEADVVAEFLDKAGFVALKIIQNVIHAREYWRCGPKAKPIAR